MTLQSIKINDMGDRQYITLAERGGDQTLTIVIGYGEAQAIHRFAKDERPLRPLTHDLLVSLLEASGSVVERIDVTELREGTFYAMVRLRRADGEVAEVDARPSDAIALATALKKPIFVAEDVIREANAL